MAKIKKEDLQHLSDYHVREIYLLNHNYVDELNRLPEKIKQYVIGNNDNNHTQRLMRVKSLLQQIMIERFLIKTKSK